MVIVDTCIWSLVLRRASIDISSDELSIVHEMQSLISDGKAVILGPIRQELLSGVRHEVQFERLKNSISGIQLVQVEIADYDTAARFSNLCRTNGITGSSIDLLICAVSNRTGFPIFTSDRDFVKYTQILPVFLHSFGPKSV